MKRCYPQTVTSSVDHNDRALLAKDGHFFMYSIKENMLYYNSAFFCLDLCCYNKISLGSDSVEFLANFIFEESAI